MGATTCSKCSPPNLVHVSPPPPSSGPPWDRNAWSQLLGEGGNWTAEDVQCGEYKKYGDRGMLQQCGDEHPTPNSLARPKPSSSISSLFDPVPIDPVLPDPEEVVDVTRKSIHESTVIFTSVGCSSKPLVVVVDSNSP